MKFELGKKYQTCNGKWEAEILKIEPNQLSVYLSKSGEPSRLYFYSPGGVCFNNPGASFHLAEIPQKFTFTHWVNVWLVNGKPTMGILYKTEEQAKRNTSNNPNYIGTYPFTVSGEYSVKEDEA